MRKILAAAFVILLFLCPLALSEEETYNAKKEYGVVERGNGGIQTFALIDELDVAYFTLNQPFITKGKPVTLTLHATGGDGNYSYTFSVFHRTGTSGSFSRVAYSGTIKKNSYQYTPAHDSGQFIALVRIADSAGYYIQWQSPVFETSRSSAAVKAVSLAEECRQAASTDYARALWLHDWLITHADYDHSETYYYADGVLLNGKGVCQSYALAYEMLLKLVGLDTIHVTGWAGSKEHAWNLVKIDGKWYHVDTTWDDPAPGQENHTYFCVTDEFIGRDHYWKHEYQILPESVKPDYSYPVRAGAKTCAGTEELIAILNESLELERAYTEIWYTGANSYFDFDEAVKKWYDQARFPESFVRYRLSKNVLSLKVEMDFGNGYPDLTKPQSISLKENKKEMSAGQSMELFMLTLPMNADTSGVSLSSSDESVIRIEKGVLRAINPGVCEIYASHPSGAGDKIVMYVNSDIVIFLPSGMTHLKTAAFSGCRYLETVLLPEGVLEIGDNAFLNCTLLKTISLPDSVSKIGKNAFSGCGRVVIECTEGSRAHEYALTEGIAYCLVSK